MTKARDIASATTPNANAALLATFPHRNLIINGAMQVAQRGTSFTLNTSNTEVYTLDRMNTFCVGGAEITVTQDTDAPDVFTNSVKVTNSTAQTTDASDYTTIGQHIEGYNMSSSGMGTSAAKDVTLSFWVKSSVTGTYGVTIRAGNAATANYTASYTINSANTWEQKIITFPATSSGTWYTTNGIGGDVFWDLGVGSNFTQTAGSWNTSSNKFGLTGGTKLTETASATWQITGVQLEVGSTATPFEHRSYGDELARCQRYYEQSDRTTAGGNREVQWRRYSVMSTWSMYSNTFLVQKRANPTIVVYDSAGTANRVNVNDNISDPNNVTPSSAAANNTRSMYVQVQYSNNINGFSYNYSADAEL